MTIDQSVYLDAMGIQTWQLKSSSQPPTVKTDWHALKTTIQACTRCALHKTRTQTVFGVGNPQAKLMLIGEAPGFYEDQKGEPFVGRAGQLLNAMLEAIGYSRSEVYIANILKCRPPNNRDPLPEEVQQCTPFLQQQIAFIQPQLLVALGRISAQYLLDTKTSLGQLRNRIHTYGPSQIPLLVTYHPAYLLRTPKDKAKAYQDFITATKHLMQ